MSKKFDVVIGNPPYQQGRTQIYTSFYTDAINVADNVCMIFPTGWQEPKTANALSVMNNKKIKRDKQIMSITNLQNAFVGVAGAEWTNVILWQKGHDNKLKGKQRIINGNKETHEKLPIKKEDIPKPSYIVDLYDKVSMVDNYESLESHVSGSKPYGVRSDIWRRPEKYDLPPMSKVDEYDNSLRVFTSDGFYYVPEDYPFPKITGVIDKFKVFVPKAWGNWSEHNGLGGAYADIYIGYPKDVSSETYLEVGSSNSKVYAEMTAKYLMSSFARGLMYVNKFSQNNARGAYKAIPQQDFTEEWWELSVAEIDGKLFEKYNVPEDIKQMVYDNIQIRDESNIIDYGPKSNVTG